MRSMILIFCSNISRRCRGKTLLPPNILINQMTDRTTTNMNDPYVTCPYEKAHRVPQSRLQAHVVKCEQHYPKLSICPYNATHRMHYEEMLKHVHVCPSKIYVLSTDYMLKRKHIGDNIKHPLPTLQTKVNDDEEIWD